jgi:hypothetical protein
MYTDDDMKITAWLVDFVDLACAGSVSIKC